MSRVEVADLSFAYGAAPVLRGVSLTVEDGSLTTVVGPSGCGKTTLLRLLAGFERPASGVVTIGDTTVAGQGFVPSHRRRIGMVPQEGALFPHLTLARNVGLGLPRRSPATAARVAELLRLGSLEELGDRLPRELSGGQQQRAALLRALAPRPRLILLDEPFASLDAEVRVRLRGSVREVLKAEGATALLVTHDRGEALSTADAVVVMLGGRVAQAGTPEDVYARPASRAVATLVGEAGFVPAQRHSASAVVTALGQLEVAAPSALALALGGEVMLRPEQLVIDPSGVPGRVVSAEYAGPSTRAVVALDDHPPLVLPVALPPGVRVGDAVRLVVRGPVHVLPTAPPPPGVVPDVPTSPPG